MGRSSEIRGGPIRRPHARAQRWNLIAVATALVTALGAALLPLSTSSSIDSNGIETSARVSLLSSEGPIVLIVVAIPVLLVAFPLLLRGPLATYSSRVVVVVVLGALVIVGAASIGLFFAPTAMAMVMSLSAESTSRPVPAAAPRPPPWT